MFIFVFRMKPYTRTLRTPGLSCLRKLKNLLIGSECYYWGNQVPHLCHRLVIGLSRTNSSIQFGQQRGYSEPKFGLFGMMRKLPQFLDGYLRITIIDNMFGISLWFTDSISQSKLFDRCSATSFRRQKTTFLSLSIRWCLSVPI